MDEITLELTEGDLIFLSTLHKAHTNDPTIVDHLETTLSACKGMVRSIRSIDDVSVVVEALNNLLYHVQQNPDTLISEIERWMK